jgi:hypothetical protein
MPCRATPAEPCRAANANTETQPGATDLALPALPIQTEPGLHPNRPCPAAL